jgi:hypothetical protein
MLPVMEIGQLVFGFIFQAFLHIQVIMVCLVEEDILVILSHFHMFRLMEIFFFLEDIIILRIIGLNLF